jgi:hypothetical protein
MGKRIIAMASAVALGLASMALGVSPAKAADCSSPGGHCRAIVHWPVHEINGIDYFVDPMYQCFNVLNPSVDFVTTEGWVGPDDTDIWVEAGDAYGYPNGAKEYHFWAESNGANNYHEYQIPDGVPNASRSFLMELWDDGKWRVALDGLSVGTSTIPGNPATSADAGMESTAPSAHIDNAIRNLAYIDTAGKLNQGWNSSNYHPTLKMVGSYYDVGWITKYTSIAVSGNVCSSTSPKSNFGTSRGVAPVTVQGVQKTLRRLSERSGEWTPQKIEAVNTSKSIAEVGNGVAASRVVPVVVVQAAGSFVGYAAKVPAGKKLPHGKYLTVTIEASTGDVLDWGITSRPTKMSDLGTVQILR